MNWLNINTTHMRDPLWVKSDATQRGAWLSMLGYCTERETNGIIVGSRLWTDRQWIHSTGLMASEVGDSSLWRWVGDDLHLELYPHEMQSMVVARREGGRKGGQAKTEAKANASQINGKAKLNPSLTQAEPKQEPNVIVIERERVIEKKTEAVADATPIFPQGLQTHEFADAWKDWVAYRKERGQTLKPTTIKAQLSTRQDWGAADAVAAIRQSIMNGWQGIFEPRSNGQPKKPGGTSTYELEARAHGYTL